MKYWCGLALALSVGLAFGYAVSLYGHSSDGKELAAVPGPLRGDAADGRSAGGLSKPQAPLSVDRSPVLEAVAAEAHKEFVAQIVENLPWQPVPVPEDSAGEYLEGIPHGEWSIFHEANGATEMGRYFLGARWGVWKTFLDGRLVQEGPMVNSKRHGLWRERISKPGQSERWLSAIYVDGVPQID